MNILEQQMDMGRKMMELNSEWFRTLAEFDASNVQKYVEMNQTFAKKLPEVKDVQSFMELQRDYSATLWESAQEAMRNRGEMVQEAMTAQGEIVRDAFTPADAKKASKSTRARKAA